MGMRAISENPDTARLLGVDATRIIVYTFMISSALAGAAGFLLALRTGVVSPHVGLPIGIKAMAVMAIGGMGNLVGAMLAGLLVGLLEVLTYAYGSASYSEIVVWGAFILVLLFKPSGLFAVRGTR